MEPNETKWIDDSNPFELTKEELKMEYELIELGEKNLEVMEEAASELPLDAIIIK